MAVMRHLTSTTRIAQSDITRRWYRAVRGHCCCYLLWLSPVSPCVYFVPAGVNYFQTKFTRVMNQYKTGLFLKQGFENGMLHHMPNLARITFKFCKSHGSSRYMREYIEEEIVEFAKANPATVVYLRPRRHRDPSIVAEYTNGHREQLRCNPFLKNELIKWVEHLRTSAGHESLKLLRYQMTRSPSVQGAWNPWVHRKTEDNIEPLPSQELSRALERFPSATQRVLDAVAADRLR